MAVPLDHPMTCPLCHTPHQIGASDTPGTGAAWLCARCGQTWSAVRIATVAAYERYAVEQPS